MDDKTYGDLACPRCDHKNTGEFCMHCGELMKHRRLSLFALLKSIPDVFFDLEQGLFFSIINLFKRPGDTVRRYFSGDRNRNYKPLKFILFIGALYAYLYISFDIHGNTGSFYELLLQDARTGNQTGKHMDQFSEQYTSLLLLIQLPVIAFSTWLVFRKRKYFYGEHLVANAFFIGEISLYKIILFPLYYLANGTHWVDRLDAIYSLWIFVYLTWAFYDWLYCRKTVRGFFISLLMVLCMVFLVLILTFVLVPVLFYAKLRFFGYN